MRNVKIDKTKNIITITIDISKDFGPSASGKTIVVASTQGNIVVDPETQMKLGLNCYRPPNDSEQASQAKL
tara:strand:- start:1299 stop:1511 length:213 start_codon:yes stop_codon:yes gene_type:complete